MLFCDFVGVIVDIFMNLLFWVNEFIIDGILIGSGVVSGVDVWEWNLENLDWLEEILVDYYVLFRSLYC